MGTLSFSSSAYLRKTSKGAWTFIKCTSGSLWKIKKNLMTREKFALNKQKSFIEFNFYLCPRMILNCIWWWGSSSVAWTVTHSLQLLSGSLWPTVIMPVRLSFLDQVNLFKIFKIILNRINILALKTFMLQLSLKCLLV